MFTRPTNALSLHDEAEATLRSLRDAASGSLTCHVLRDEHDSADYARAVWHAAEFALGMLNDGYVPKYEAIIDARELVQGFERYGDFEMDEDESVGVTAGTLISDALNELDEVLPTAKPEHVRSLRGAKWILQQLATCEAADRASFVFVGASESESEVQE